MKKIKLIGLRSKVYKGFLVSTFGLVLLALNLIMILSFRHVAENMREEEIRVLRNKLYTVAEDMDNQMGAMTNIVMKIVFRKEFRPDYILEERYHAVEAVEQLKGYSDFSDISREYFIKYASIDKLFTSAGTTIAPEIYFSTKQGMKDSDSILELLEGLCQETRQGLFLYREEGKVVLLYPLQVYSSGKYKMKGVVGFFVTASDITERANRIAGSIHGDMSMFYGDFCIMGSQEDKEGSDFGLTSRPGGVSVYIRTDMGNYFSWSNVFSVKEAIALVWIVVLLLGLTCMAAWWNYLPFRKMAMKYAAMLEDARLDWNDIDTLIEFLLHEKENNSKLVEEQYRMLREQAIHLIVSGGYSQRLQKRLTLLNINLNFSVFGIIRTSFQKEQITESSREELCRNIEELSEKGYCLYSYWDGDKTLQILAAVEEEYELAETVELLQSLFEAIGLTADVELGAACHELENLHLLGQKRDTERGKDSESARVVEERTDTKKGNAKQKSSIREVVAYIEAHCTDYDLSLDMIASQVRAVKKGNPDAMLACNNAELIRPECWGEAGKPQMKKWFAKEDFITGELTDFVFVPDAAFVDGARAHFLIPLGTDEYNVGWRSHGVKRSPGHVKDYVRKVHEAGGVVTIDIYVDRYGHFDEDQMAVLRGI
ncbi:MAG: hypothetical protein HFH96_08420 [Lachnospiraceae bacterium]|nr:hypothetical protein [uncultured Acetatifactor sp.]MCI9231116.1 hypothetical protein [Lachnospiraceae bacterium]